MTLGPFSIISFHFWTVLHFTQKRNWFPFHPFHLCANCKWGGWGRAGASILGLDHQPCPVQCGQWGRHQQSHLQAGEVLGGSAARMWCCTQGCRGSHGYCLLNISDANSGEGEVVTHHSKGWASPGDWEVQKERVLLCWVTKSLSCWEIWLHTSRQSRSAGYMAGLWLIFFM